MIFLRILQGLALGGEYGGAAIYVSEHSPPGRRGFFTGFIQASVIGGFVLSLAVVLACRLLIPAEDFAAWGWRLPFLLSILLLAISLWMRLKLSESPVFKAMKEEGKTSRNPFVESFTYPGNKKRIFVALFGVACGLTIIFYTALFSTLSFLKGPMRVDDTAAELIVGVASLIAVPFVRLLRLAVRPGRPQEADRVGLPASRSCCCSRCSGASPSWPIPKLAATARATPVEVAGPGCSYDPFAAQAGDAVRPAARGPDRARRPLRAERGRDAAAHRRRRAAAARRVRLGRPRRAPRADPGWLGEHGYDLAKQVPPAANILGIVLILVVFGSLSGATFGPVASLLSEMFPPRIRYSSMSIPYHIGTGYFGGFLPLIAGYDRRADRRYLRRAVVHVGAAGGRAGRRLVGPAVGAAARLRR